MAHFGFFTDSDSFTSLTHLQTHLHPRLIYIPASLNLRHMFAALKGFTRFDIRNTTVKLRGSDELAKAFRRRARLSTGASREAPVGNECFSISHTKFHMQLRSSDQQAEALKRRARLSTGASREAPVDNECFQRFCDRCKSRPGC